jgi:TIR domain
MQVFLSWSGERSKAAAKSFADWLPLVIQSVKPWYSEQIESGARWSNEIATRLDATNFGLVMVTPENQHAPWLLFEAGALAKSISDARVVPVLIDFQRKTDLSGPLSQFQACLPVEEDMLQLVRDINRGLGDDRLNDSTIGDTFNAFWKRLTDDLEEISAKSLPGRSESQRSSDDILREVLDRVRSQEKLLRSMSTRQISTSALAALKAAAVVDQGVSDKQTRDRLAVLDIAKPFIEEALSGRIMSVERRGEGLTVYTIGPISESALAKLRTLCLAIDTSIRVITDGGEEVMVTSRGAVVPSGED